MASTRQQPLPRVQAPHREDPPEVVDPVWLLKALAICVAAALLCGYATLCLLFYQGEWQLVLHPGHTIDDTPATVGLAFENVRFDSAQTGQPRLTAWWIAAGPGAGLAPRYPNFTVLYLHGGSGSLSETVPMLGRLHAAGLNVFAIDYRGFGASDSSDHPSEDRMQQDAAAALQYLTETRHIPSSNIVPYGAGLGAPLAAHLAQSNPRLPAVVLDNPDPDPASTARAARPSSIVPVRLLFGNRFGLAAPLVSLPTPKLLIAGGPGSVGPAADRRKLEALFRSAASPRLTVTLTAADSESQYQSTLTRFLDQYLRERSP